MAMSKNLFVTVGLTSDGSNTAVIDLERDPIFINSLNSLGEPDNNFLRGKANMPVGVKVGIGPFTQVATGAVLAYPLVTITFASNVPAGTDGNISFELLF